MVEDNKLFTNWRSRYVFLHIARPLKTSEIFSASLWFFGAIRNYEWINKDTVL